MVQRTTASNYALYLKQVLGIKSVLISQHTFQSFQSSTDQQLIELQPLNELKVSFIDESPWSSAAFSLFDKMREAMNLKTEEVQVLFLDQTSLPQICTQVLNSKQIMCFNENVMQQLSQAFSENIQKTFSPELLIKKPELKKQAWQDLQDLMKKLNLKK